MSAEKKLREAAKVLRERAETEAVLRDGDPYYVTEASAFERIMTPDLGLALADWLDVVAQRAEEVASTLAPNSQAREPIVNSLLAFREAVAVADVILGGAS